MSDFRQVFKFQNWNKSQQDAAFIAWERQQKSIDRLQARIKELESQNEKLTFMVENGLGYEDLINDVGRP